jgi:hypothetical protein
LDTITFLARRFGTKVLQYYLQAAYKQVTKMDGKRSFDDGKELLRQLAVVLDLFDKPPENVGESFKAAM